MDIGKILIGGIPFLNSELLDSISQFLDLFLLEFLELLILMVHKDKANSLENLCYHFKLLL